MSRFLYSLPWLLVSVCSALIIGCPGTEVLPELQSPGEAPSAAFSFTPAETEVGVPVQFADESKPGSADITDWLWDFGDGSVSLEQHPAHTYQDPDSYTVSLTVTSPVGSDTATLTLVVSSKAAASPTADFSFTPTTGAVGTPVQFTDESSPGSEPITSWLWDFGDGTTRSGRNQIHTYQAYGAFTVSLTVTSTVGSDTEQRLVYVMPEHVDGPAGSEFHVAVTGSPSGDGSTQNPWDLQTALNQPDAVMPGDTIWLHGGTYHGDFNSFLEGTESAPIVIRQFPGERAILDGGDSELRPVLRIRGSWTWCWGFEVMSSDPVRVCTESWEDCRFDLPRGSGINTGGSPGEGIGAKLINLVIHDARSGATLWEYAENAEVYGCLIYHNGFQAPDRTDGHGIYTHGGVGTRHIVDNIFFGGFAFGIHAYGSDGQAVDNFHVEGNVAFCSGDLSSVGPNGNLLVGSVQPSHNIQVENNYTYSRGAYGDAGGIGVSGPNGPNYDAVVLRNYFAGEFFVRNWQDLVFRENTVIHSDRIIWLLNQKLAVIPEYDWDGNAYYCRESNGWRPCSLTLPDGSFTLAFEDWKALTGFDQTSVYVAGMPTAMKVFVRPNLYERGRANIIVYNWPLLPAVAVNVSGILVPGDQFVLRDAQNFFGAPVLSGTYNGAPLNIPMNQTQAVQGIGDVPLTYQHTAPEFGVFILLRAQ